MSIYDEVRTFVRTNYGFDPKTGWIAHCKELNGLPVKRAPNRIGEQRVVPCPPDKRPAIEAAFRHLGLLSV